MGIEEQFRRRPEVGPRVAVKVAGAIIFGVVLLGTLIWGELPFAIGMSLAAAVGSVELFSLFNTKSEAVPTAAVVGIAGAAAYVIMAHYRPLTSFGYITALLIFVSFIWYMLVLRHVKPTKAVALTVLAPLLTGFCLSHLVMLRDSVDGICGRGSNSGMWMVLFLIALIWVYDVLAWAVGRKVGEHKIAPSISPNKSWEGALAGTVGVLVASVLFRLIIKSVVGRTEYAWFSVWVALVIAVIVVMLGPLGDFAESVMKRDYGVKDTGRLIPGHGGIMDRFDSTLFTAPAVFYYLSLIVFKAKI